MIIIWKVINFEQMSNNNIFDMYSLRNRVFIVEQECAYQDVDEKDLICLHLFNYDKENLVSYCRLIENEKSIQIGRVVVDKQYRGESLGRELIEKAIEVAKKEYPKKPIYAQAQAYLQNFYASFGFKTISEIYLEDDIPHIDMLLTYE